MAGKFSLADHIQKTQPPQVRDIETITAEILDAKRAGGEAILTIGKGLMEAKAMLPHGEWLPWLTERVEFSESTAQRFMRLARDWSNPSALTDLGATKALMLLAIPTESREEFISTPHLVGGEEKTVIDMTSRELEATIKERDEALKAAELAKAEQSAAEQAREKMAQDMVFIKKQLQLAQKGQDDALKNAEEQKEAFDASEREIARLEQALEELRSRPVEVAVQADEAAVEAARKEAEERMQVQLDKARAEREKVRDELMEVNSALQRAKLEREQVEIELRKQLAQAEKKASLSASEDLVLFRTLFNQVQELANKLGGVLMKVRNKDPEKAEGLKRALLALAENIREAAQG